MYPLEKFKNAEKTSFFIKPKNENVDSPDRQCHRTFCIKNELTALFE